MNVVKIVVDELQSACYNCKFFHINGGFSDECIATSKLLDNYDILHGIPDWCPLQLEEELEWVLEEYEMCISPHNNGNWCDKDEYQFCPTCGKRIKYVEVE